LLEIWNDYYCCVTNQWKIADSL